MHTVKLLSEFLGTFLLILSVLASGGNALFVGLTLSLVIFFTAKTSGGHANPAVSFVMFLKNKLTTEEFASEVVAQMLGGAVCLYMFKALA
uniref:Major intrinsic protein n=1 Tax=viral metagenome TaxID=1070528 RepID=A0A6C0JWZ9_9ZZZZ